jgi:methylthioribose-1-phosphate isomerase
MSSTTALPLVSIREGPNSLEIVDQLLLPHTIRYIRIESIEQAHDAIKTMKVRVPAISVIAMQNDDL